MSKRQCNQCWRTKSVSEFFVVGKRQDGTPKLKAQCKACCLDYQRAYRLANPKPQAESIRKTALWSKYRLTVKEYDQLFAKQQGLCAICKKGQVIDCRLAVDHCHSTARVRGLLCNNCNRGIGSFADDPERLIAAAKYLRRAKRNVARCADGD